MAMEYQMAKAKKLARIDFTKGELGKAIAADAASQVAHADSVRETWRKYVGLVREGHFTPDHAQAFIEARQKAVDEKRKANHLPPKKWPEIKASRVSEVKSILRLSKWNCWNKVFDALKGMEASEGGRGINDGTLLAASKFIRLGVKDGDKVIVAPWPEDKMDAPSRDAIMKHVNNVQNARGGARETGNGKPSTKALSMPQANNALASMLNNVKRMAKAKELKGNRAIDALKRQIETVGEIVAKAIKAAEKEEADA